MVKPVSETDIQLDVGLDENSLREAKKQFSEFAKSLTKVASGKIVDEGFSGQFKAAANSYKGLRSQIMKTYKLDEKQSTIIADKLIKGNPQTKEGKSQASLALKEIKSEALKPQAKDWTLKQLMAKEEDYQALDRMYDKLGYSQTRKTRAINKQLGPNFVQSRKAEAESLKLLKEENKEKKKNLPYMKEVGKLLGGKFLRYGVAGAVGYGIIKAIGGATSAAYNVATNKQTYSGYSKALEETVYRYGGGKEGVEALGGFYGQYYGFKERLMHGMADTSIFEKLAKATGDSSLIESIMTDSTEVFFDKMIKRATKMSDEEAYNLFNAVGYDPKVGMDLLRDYRSGDAQAYYKRRQAFEETGLATGQAGIQMGEDVRGALTKGKDFINQTTDYILKKGPGRVVPDLLNSPLPFSSVLGKEGASIINNYFNNDIKGPVTEEQKESVTDLNDRQYNVILKNEQKVR